MVLRRYIEHVNSSTIPAEDVTALFAKPIRLANLLLRPCTESPVQGHEEIIRCLVETYPFINDVEGGGVSVEMIIFSMGLTGLVLDLILDVISNSDGQILAATVDLIIQDIKSSFVMKLALGL